MDKETNQLLREIQAFENELNARENNHVASKLSAEIQQINNILAGMYMEQDTQDDAGEFAEVGETGEAGEAGMMYMDDGEVEVMASEVDPSGAEEKITQAYLTEVNRLLGEESLTDAPSIKDIVSMKQASASLDRIASYLESSGDPKHLKFAYAIDQIADAIEKTIQ